VPFDIASQSGLKKQYPIRVKTANGVTNAFLTRINTLVLGNIELHNISAVIMTQSHGDVLLGMSALKTLEMKQEEGTLRLIKKPTP
jgi:aspartyl protease family protein